MVAAYAAAVVAFGFAAVSLYWTMGGHLLLDTVGGSIEEMARRGGPAAVALGLVATVLKTAGGLLALALVSSWGRVIPRVWLLACSAAASVVLVLYGGLLVIVGALVLSGAVHPAGAVDRTALRWHVLVWDLWFLVWGVLLALAAVAHWRGAPATPSPLGPADTTTPVCRWRISSPSTTSSSTACCKTPMRR
jgi:hypothetical protein